MSLEMKVGDAILFKGKGILGKIISFATRSEYTHCGCYIGNGEIVESDWGGVQVNNIEGRNDFDVYTHNKANYRQRRDAVRWMLDQKGKGYDYRGLVGIGLSLLRGCKRNKLDQKDKYWCSELLADGYIKAHIEAGFNHNTWITAPKDFANPEYFTKSE